MPSGTKPPPDAFNRAVMAIIRARMTELDYTAADLARLADVPPSTLSRILSSEKQPSIQLVRRIAIALKLGMAELMARAEP